MEIEDKEEMVRYIKYAADKRACKDFGVYFEHLCRPCPFLFESPNGEILSVGVTHSIHTQIEIRLPELAPATTYTLRDVCGDAYWKKLNKTQWQMAHDSVNYLIEHQGLPIVCIALATGKRYQLSK